MPSVQEDFQDFLENFRILHEIAVPITKTVTAIGKYDKDTHSVVVEVSFVDFEVYFSMSSERLQY